MLLVAFTREIWSENQFFSLSREKPLKWLAKKAKFFRINLKQTKTSIFENFTHKNYNYCSVIVLPILWIETLPPLTLHQDYWLPWWVFHLHFNVGWAKCSVCHLYNIWSQVNCTILDSGPWRNTEVVPRIGLSLTLLHLSSWLRHFHTVWRVADIFCQQLWYQTF